MTSTEEIKPVLLEAARRAGVVDWATDVFAGTPVRVRRGVNEAGKTVTYFLNYSGRKHRSKRRSPAATCWPARRSRQAMP